MTLPDEVLKELEAVRILIVGCGVEKRLPTDLTDKQIGDYFGINPETARVKLKQSGQYDRISVVDENLGKIKAWRKKA